METSTLERADAQPSEPIAPAQRVAVLDSAQLEVAISNALLFASTETNRPLLAAVRFEAVDNPSPISGPTRCEKAFRLVATDSYALVVDYVPGDGFACWPAEGLLLDRFGLVDAHKLVKAAAKNRQPVTIEPGERFATFGTAGQSIEVRTVEGDYPQFERLFPTATGSSVTLFTSKMLARLGKLRAAGTKTPSVELTAGPEAGKPVRFEVLDSECYGLAMPAGTIKSGRNARTRPGRWSGE